MKFVPVSKWDGFDAGADDYMVKPFDFRELNARIKVLLKRVAGNAQAVTPLVRHKPPLSDSHFPPVRSSANLQPGGHLL